MKTTYFLDGKFSIGYFLLIMSFLIGVYGCATDSTVRQNQPTRKTISIELLDRNAFSQKSYKDADRDLSLYKTYAFDYTNTNNPLLEKELFKMLDDVLKKKGLKKDINNPELLITMNFYTGKKETYTPPETITTTRVEQVWSTGSIGWTLWGAYTPVPITESKTTPGYTSVKYYNNIRLNFLDYSKLRSGEKPKVPPLIYVGEIDGEGDSSDIRSVALDMIDRLINGECYKIKMSLGFLDIFLDGTLRDDAIVITEFVPEYYPGGRKQHSQVNADAVGLHRSDIIRKIGGISPSRFVENTIKGSFPAPIRKATQSVGVMGGKMVDRDSWGYEFDNNEVVLEVECPHLKTTKRF